MIELKTPYCQSRYHDTPKLNKEIPNDYERRTWRERLHVDDDGQIVVPGLAFANSLKEAAKFLSLQIPGKGKSTYTKHFAAGISVLDDVGTGKSKEEAIEKRMFVPSDGRTGGGSRVMKSYPILLPPIKLEVEYLITDDIITAEVFAHHIMQAGSLIGIGAFRVRNNGVFGRYVPTGIKWEENPNKQALPPITYLQAA